MSGGRQWSMAIDVQCRVETCSEKDTACVCATSAHDAVEGVKTILRYRGWTFGRLDDLCPAHSGPIPACEICGQPTPRPYGVDGWSARRDGVSWACWPCHHRASDLRLAADFIQAREQATP